MEHRRDISAYLRHSTAILLGLTIPAMVSGRAVLQGIAAAAFLIALWLAARDTGVRARFWQAASSHFGIAVAVAFAGMSVSIWGSLDPFRSFDAWARTGGYILACVLFWAILVGDADTRRLCQRIFIGAFVVLSATILMAQLGFELPYAVVHNQLESKPYAWAFKAPKGFAAAAACCVPALIGLAAYETPRWRATAVTGAVFAVIIVFTTVNKSALGGLLAMVLVVSLAMAARRGRRFILGWVVFAIAASGLGAALVYKLPDEPASRAVWDWMPPQLIDTHRQQIWNFTAGKIAEKPWTGYGINVIERVPGAHKQLPGYNAEAIPSHPHNWALEILGETGVIGFVPVLIAIAWFGWRHLRRHALQIDRSSLAQLGIAATFWGSSLFNFSIWSSWWLITCFLLTAIVAAGSAGKTTSPAADV